MRVGCCEQQNVQKFYAAANADMGKLECVWKGDVWNIVLDPQLFPVLSYGSHYGGRISRLLVVL